MTLLIAYLLYVNCLYESCWDCLQNEWCFTKWLMLLSCIQDDWMLLICFTKILSLLRWLMLLTKWKGWLQDDWMLLRLFATRPKVFMYLFHFTLRVLFTKKNDVVNCLQSEKKGVLQSKRLFTLFKVAFKLLLVSLYRHWKHWFAHSKNSTVDA